MNSFPETPLSERAEMTLRGEALDGCPGLFPNSPWSLGMLRCCGVFPSRPHTRPERQTLPA